MKRILHMTPPEINNGVYKYLFNHMKYINKSEYQFEFLTRNKEDLMKSKEFHEYHFPIWSFTNTERNGREGLRKEIVRILDNGFDAVHLHTSIWRGFLIEEIAMEVGIPQVIVHSHSTGVDFVSAEDRKRLLKIHEEYKRQFDMRMATDVCACSKMAGEWLFGKQIPRDQIKILPNAIDVEQYHFNPEIRKLMRNRMGVEDRIVIGNIGRYSYQKNQEFLIRAFVKAWQKRNSLFLMLIGQGELEGYLKNLIKELGVEDSAVCLNWQENVWDYLQVMDVFCIPSHFEGLSICAIEAQAAGLTCYVSDTLSEETKITDLVEYIPLSENIWEKKISESEINVNRKCMDEEIASQGYDIKSAVGQLINVYG